MDDKERSKLGHYNIETELEILQKETTTSIKVTSTGISTNF